MGAVASRHQILEDRAPTERSRHEVDKRRRQACCERFIHRTLAHKVLSGILICLAFVLWHGASRLAARRHASAIAQHRGSSAVDVWSISYPQGGEAIIDQPFQLHVGSSIEILPQLVARRGTTCSVKPPQLPAGLTLNQSTCVIQGVPTLQTAEKQTFVITAANSKASASALVVLTVGPALQGTIRTVAGSGDEEGGDRVPEASESSGLEEQLLQWPESLCAHRGKLYIGQQCSIAEMDLHSSQVRLLLGDKECGNRGDGEQKEHVKVGLISGLAVHQEELYFTDRKHNVVRKVGLPRSEAPGLVSRVAGTGEAGFAGDGGQATAAKLDTPGGLAILSGKLLIADSLNDCIRSVDLEGEHSGIITTVAGNPESDEEGQSGSVSLDDPKGLLVVAQMVYVIDSGNSRICSIDFQRSPPEIATFAGGGEKTIDKAPAAEWQLSDPTGLTLGRDGKMYVACWGDNRTVLAVDLQQPDHPTSLVAATGEEGEGADVDIDKSSSLEYPSAVAAVGRDTIYVTEWHRIRAVSLAKSVDHVPFLGTWSSWRADGTLASPFSLPASTAYISPALPTTPSVFHFSLEFDGLSFPPSVLGLADMESIKRLSTNRQTKGIPSDFIGVAIMLIPEADAYSARDTKVTTVTGWVSRREFGDRRCEYALKDVMLSRMPAAPPSPTSMITRHVGIDVPMHVFMAAWGPATQLRIIVENPPLLERSWT